LGQAFEGGHEAKAVTGPRGDATRPCARNTRSHAAPLGAGMGEAEEGGEKRKSPRGAGCFLRAKGAEGL